MAVDWDFCCGAGCFFGAAACYYLGKSSAWNADFLKTVTRVNHLKDLSQLLDATSSKLLPLIVTISGKVGPDIVTMCDCAGLQGVIVEEMNENRILKRIRKWKPDHRADGVGVCSLIEKTNEIQSEIPWYGMIGGVMRTERFLHVGTPLTVVGEAVKDDIGTIRIQQPHKVPFYVSPKTIDQLSASYGQWERMYRYASLGFLICGIYLIAKFGLQYFMERKRHRELRKRVRHAAAKRQGRDNEGSNTKIDDQSDGIKKGSLMPELCAVCSYREYTVVFFPCGHMCCCKACASKLKTCPLCRQAIERKIRTRRL